LQRHVRDRSLELAVPAGEHAAVDGGRASGTNDKVGSPLALQRWVNARYVKENFAPALDWTYPYMGRS
jgi:hypothetical protein